jgi:phosphinothricin acetyltransferase
VTGGAGGPTIRPCREEDVPAIQTIYSHAVLTGFASFEEEAPDVDEMKWRRSEILARGFPYFVAELDGRIAGYAYASTYRTRSAYRFAVEDSIYVAPDLGRRGIGRALLGRLVQRAGELGFRQMIAVIGDSANAASINLHAACGFTMIGVMPAIGWKRGRWVDSVLMQRALGAGSTAPPVERASG